MASKNSIDGIWKGRLIDVQGFEGELTLNLKQNKSDRSVSGSFNVAIGVNHSSLRQEGIIKGTLEDNILRLEFESDSKQPAHIYLAGHIQPLKSGGFGLKSTYQVSTRYFSPFQAGVVTANTGSVLTDRTIQPQEAVRQPSKVPSSKPGKKRKGSKS